MKKVISFSIYKAPKNWEISMETNYKKYILGLYENLKLIKKIYPDWYVFLYHDKNLNPDDLLKLKEYEKFKNILIDDENLNAMQWRFLPLSEDDVGLFISRDADSRVSVREKKSVDEWIESNNIIHIMRDHPHHCYSILGGMWGMKKIESFNIEKEIKMYNKSKKFDFEKNWFDKWWDMNFLKDVIYPKFLSSSYINCSYNCIENFSKKFTLDRENNHFIGEIFDENNQRGYHYNLIK